jgi:hypothetical protein
MTNRIVFILSAIVALGFCEDNTGLGYTKLPGSFYDISANGKELWGVDRNGGVFRYNSSTSDWKLIPAGIISGTPVRIGASADGWTWLVTIAPANIYRYNVGTGAWELEGGGTVTGVSALSKDQAIVVGLGPSPWQFVPPAAGFSPIYPEIYGKTQWLAICDNNVKWAVTTTGLVFRYNETTKAFGRMRGINIATIDCQCDDRVVMTTNTGLVHVWIADNWSLMPLYDHAVRATITNDTVYILTETEEVYSMKLPVQGQ